MEKRAPPPPRRDDAGKRGEDDAGGGWKRKGTSTVISTAGESGERERGGGSRSLSIADEFNGIAFRCIPVELTARGPSKSIRENLFGVMRAAPTSTLRMVHSTDRVRWKKFAVFSARARAIQFT